MYQHKWLHARAVNCLNFQAKNELAESRYNKEAKSIGYPTDFS
jgi:hypothetical protein